MWLLWLFLVILFEVAADIFSKEWSLAPRLILLLGGIICYMAANLFWLFSLRYGSGLARGVTIFAVTSTIVAVIIGLIFYKESVSTIQIIGILFGVIAIMLIFWNDLMKVL